MLPGGYSAVCGYKRGTVDATKPGLINVNCSKRSIHEVTKKLATD